MAQATWPSVGQVAEVFTANGLTPPDNATLQIAIDAATEEFGRLTGFEPFEAEGVAQYYRYDPPEYGDTLDLRGGVVEVTQVMTSYDPVEDDGTELDEDEDYRLLPPQAEIRGEPFTQIQFIGGVSGDPGSIRILARSGYSATIPTAVFQAVKFKAFAGAALETSGGSALFASEIVQGPIRLKFGSGESSGGAILKGIEDEFMRQVRRYRKVIV